MLAIEVLGYDVFSAPLAGAPRKAASELQTSGFHAAPVAPNTDTSLDCEPEGRNELFFPELVRAEHRMSCQAGGALSGCCSQAHSSFWVDHLFMRPSRRTSLSLFVCYVTQVGESSEDEEGCEMLHTLSAVLERVILAAEVSPRQLNTYFAASSYLLGQDLPVAIALYATLPFSPLVHGSEKYLMFPGFRQLLPITALVTI